MSNLLSIIIPVLEGMEESHLKNQLLQHFPTQSANFKTVEDGFSQLTSLPPDPERLKAFFHSWSQTNNSAVTVAGLSNRMTMMVHKNMPIPDEHSLLRSIASLNRIVDEDLAVVGNVLHSDLFYNMATGICGDDGWLSRAYLDPNAKAFKAWKDRNSMRERDLMVGLLTTLVHEIYTHGEVEYILPKFTNWLNDRFEFPKNEQKHVLAWITVHCGPTEKNHFFYAVNSIMYYAKAMNINLEDYDLTDIVADYLNKKAIVIQTISEQLVAVA